MFLSLITSFELAKKRTNYGNTKQNLEKSLQSKCLTRNYPKTSYTSLTFNIKIVFVCIAHK